MPHHVGSLGIGSTVSVEAEWPLLPFVAFIVMSIGFLFFRVLPPMPGGTGNCKKALDIRELGKRDLVF